MGEKSYPANYEHERRFLVSDGRIIERASAWVLLTQAYLFSEDGFTIRVRMAEDPTDTNERMSRSAHLAAKGPRHNAKREEYETEIPVTFAQEIISRATSVVIKKRHSLIYESHLWDLDEFQGKNYGLIIAELESDSESLGMYGRVENIEFPKWIARELVNEPRFDNESLASHPVSLWPDRDAFLLP